MDTQSRFTVKCFLHKCLTLLLLQFIFLGLAPQVFAKGASTVKEKRALARMNQEFFNKLQSRFEPSRQHVIFQQKIRNYPAGEKIGAFIDALYKAEAKGINTRVQLNAYIRQRQAENASAVISGNVTRGELGQTSEILAFDRTGFLAGFSTVEATTGEYVIANLTAGNYYVVVRDTQKNNWSRSELIAIGRDEKVSYSTIEPVATEQQFSLEHRLTKRNDAASIQGIVTGLDSLPLNMAFIFAFDLADTSIAPQLGVSEIGSGEYSLDSLAAGNYVGYADSYLNLSIDLGDSSTLDIIPHRGEYYENAASPDLATPIALAASEIRENVDFSLEAGGAISGNIRNSSGTALDSLLVIAIKFNLENLEGFITEELDLSMGFSDVAGNYVLSGLSSGDYIVRTFSFFNPDLAALFEGGFGKHAGQVLDEYYDGVQGLLGFGDATRVTVNEPDTSTGIDFDLEIAGAISGNFVELTDGTPVDGEGFVIAFNNETGFPVLALDFDTLATSYELRPLAEGQYKLLGGVDSDTTLYLPQFYNSKDFDTADPVAVTPPTTVTDINFTMVRTGSIAGTITGDAEDILVLVFDAQTGVSAGGSDANSSTGEYSITGLAPGSYVVLALPGTVNFAATYHGGGTTFDGANTIAVTVAPDAITQADITLNAGLGLITGTVTDLEANPVAGVIVIAYDATGHAVSAGVSGFDPITDEIDPNSGDFIIPGLASGDYFVRTFSFFRLLALIEEQDSDTDPLTLILGLLFDQSNLESTFGIQLYGDAWYPNQLIEIDPESLDLFGLFFSLLTSEGDISAIIPFFSDIPVGASSVSVTSPGQRSDVDFALPAIELGKLLTAVEERPDNGLVAENFQLFQNYPNPFNPGTVINYRISQDAEVKLTIYNIRGQNIRTLFEGRKESGTHAVQWNGLSDNGAQVAAGVYLLKMTSGGQTFSRKMLLVK